VPAAGLIGRIVAGGMLLAGTVLSGGAPGGEPSSSEREEFVRRLRKKTRFGFEDKVAQAPGRAPLPREWERYVEYSRTPGERPPKGAAEDGADTDLVTSRSLEEEGRLYYGRFPDFLRVEVVDLDRGGAPREVHGGRHSLRMQVAGTQLSGDRGMNMVAVRRRVALEVDPDFAYELTGWVHFKGVKKKDTYAQLWIEWLDAKGQRIGARSRSDVVNLDYLAAWTSKKGLKAVPAWVSAPEFRVNEVDRRARFARVWCVASGQEIGGWAYFDDLELRRRPKVSVRADQLGGYACASRGWRPAPACRVSPATGGRSGRWASSGAGCRPVCAASSLSRSAPAGSRSASSSMP